MTITTPNSSNDTVECDAAELACSPTSSGCPSGSGACGHAVLSRRRMLRTAAMAGTAAAAMAGLSACGHILDPNENAAAGSDMSSAPAGGMATSAMPKDPATTGAAKAGGSGEMMNSPTATHVTGTLIAKTDQIPVGGGMVVAAHKVVVTQPSAGTYKAFSSVCTHAGCQCNQVSMGQISCPCHNAVFSIKDGSVQGGPAPSPLAARTITVANGEIRLQA